MNDEMDKTDKPTATAAAVVGLRAALLKDWLFLAGLVVGIAWLSYTWTRPDANLMPGRIALDIPWGCRAGSDAVHALHIDPTVSRPGQAS